MSRIVRPSRRAALGLAALALAGLAARASAADALVLTPGAITLTAPVGGTATTTLGIRNATSGFEVWSIVVNGSERGAWTATGLWHRSTRRDFDGDGSSWYYGREDTGNYSTGAANSGALTSPPFVLTVADNVWVDYWRKTDAAPDVLRWEFKRTTDTAWSPVWELENTAGTWQRQMPSDRLLGAVGSTITMRVWFDSVTAAGNLLEGAYVDDVRIGNHPIDSWLRVSAVFGDLASAGSTATVTVTASATGLAAGTYTASIAVFDIANQGQRVPVTFTVGTADVPPAAVIAATPTTGTAPLAVAFDGTGSSDSDGSIATYAWSFGDGASATGPTASHVYAAAGDYTASLTVTDDAGATGKATRAIAVAAPNRPPVAGMTATPDTGTAPLTVAFDAAGSSDPDGVIAAYAWSFGDGATATGASASHAYATAGAYTATLTVTDDDGATASASRAITVLAANQPPLAAMTATPDGGAAPLTVGFDSAGSLDPDGSIVAFAWSFGDGATASGPTVGHVYAATGTFTATLTVTDDAGATDTASRTITVAGGDQPPVAAIAATPTSGAAPLAVVFDGGGSSDPDDGIAAYAWSFGDGATAAGATASHTYAAAGDYTATLTVTDAHGATDEATVAIAVVAPEIPPGWVSASGSEDPEDAWRSEDAASDGNPATYAEDTSNRLGDGAWLTLVLPAPILVDRVRVDADFGYDAVDAVAIEVRVHGAWLPAYTGAVDNAAATDLAIAEHVVDAVRFRFHYVRTGFWFWLYDLQVFHLPEVLAAPGVTTLDATSVWSDAAVLHARVDADGGSPVAVRFQYGPTEDYGSETPWAGALVSGQTIGARIPDGLTAGATWHFRAQARNASGEVVVGADRTLVPGPVLAPTWMSPTGSSGDGWSSRDLALDDEPASAARSFHELYAAVESPALELSLPPSRVSAVRFAAARGAQVDGLTLEVRRDGAWETVRSGDFADGALIETPIDPGSVDGVRVRMHLARPDVGQFWDLDQVQVLVDPEDVPPPSIGIAVPPAPAGAS